MKPNRQTATLSVGELTQRLVARKIIPTRFSIDLPENTLLTHLYASYVAEVQLRKAIFKLDEATKEHLRVAAKWLGDPHGKVGFMMTGLYGNGKTTMLKAMCNLINYLFDSASSSERKYIQTMKAKDIAELAMTEDGRKELKRIATIEMLAIDEVGEEAAEIHSFGMVYTPIRDLLESRYEMQRLTIIATNLVENQQKKIMQLSNHYGPRVVDRFREMMTIVPFHNPSYRKEWECDESIVPTDMEMY